MKHRLAALWLAFGALASACSPGDTPLEWRYEFDPESLATDARGLRARIFEAGCASGALRYEAELAAQGAVGSPPPALPAGRYGFSLVARNASCEEFARGCQEIQLSETTRQVTVSLQEISPSPACGASLCQNGLCQGGSSNGGGPGTDAGGGICTPVDLSCGRSCTCGECDCAYTCAGTCESVTCPAGTRCEVAADAVSNVTLNCQGAGCTMTTSSVGNVTANCSAGATCDVDCTEASNCQVACTGNAACILHCAVGANCGFSSCGTGAAQRCPSGEEWVCNAACP